MCNKNSVYANSIAYRFCKVCYLLSLAIVIVYGYGDLSHTVIEFPCELFVPYNFYRCFAHLYEPGALPLEISILRIFRVLRPFRAVRLSGLYVSDPSTSSTFWFHCEACAIYGILYSLL